MKKLGLRILSNGGYGKDQVKGPTLKELKEFIEELLEYNDEDTEVITIDDGNVYGAKYGKIYLDIIDDYEEDDEDYE